MSPRPFWTDVHASSATDLWATPQYFFDNLNAEFKFSIDACASPENAKCDRYFTAETDGLAQDWGQETAWVNPPYGRGITGRWVEKAYRSSEAGATVVMLLPARTDTRCIPAEAFARTLTRRPGSLHPAEGCRERSRSATLQASLLPPRFPTNLIRAHS